MDFIKLSPILSAALAEELRLEAAALDRQFAEAILHGADSAMLDWLADERQRSLERLYGDDF